MPCAYLYATYLVAVTLREPDITIRADGNALRPAVHCGDGVFSHLS